MVRYAQKHYHKAAEFDDFSTGHEWVVKKFEVGSY